MATLSRLKIFSTHCGVTLELRLRLCCNFPDALHVGTFLSGDSCSLPIPLFWSLWHFVYKQIASLLLCLTCAVTALPELMNFHCNYVASVCVGVLVYKVTTSA